MMKRARTWSAIGAVLLILVAAGAWGYRAHRRRARSGPEAQFREFIRGAYSVVIVPGPTRGVAVRRVGKGMISIADAACAADSPDVRRAVEYGVALECAKRDHPDFDDDAILEKAGTAVESWLSTLPEARVFPTEPTERAALSKRTDERYRTELAKTGLYDTLLASWKKHVAGESECGVEVRRQYADFARQFLTGGGICGEWDRMLEVCTSWDRSVDSHIANHDLRSATPERRDALVALIGEGLNECLARIIEKGADPDLLEGVRSLNVGTDSSRMTQVRGDAWKLWREYGVARWLDRSVETRSVPEDVRRAVNECREGVLPPRMREGTGHPLGETGGVPGPPAR